jgi:hypothetical protein
MADFSENFNSVNYLIFSKSYLKKLYSRDTTSRISSLISCTERTEEEKEKRWRGSS